MLAGAISLRMSHELSLESMQGNAATRGCAIYFIYFKDLYKMGLEEFSWEGHLER